MIEEGDFLNYIINHWLKAGAVETLLDNI